MSKGISTRSATQLLLLVLLACPPTATAQVRPPRPVGGAQCDKTTGYDVIIVGAGLARLSAARELIHRGRAVRLLEPNDRPGARAGAGETAPGPAGNPTVPIDYGGAWIHGVATNPLTQLVDVMGFRRTRS